MVSDVFWGSELRKFTEMEPSETGEYEGHKVGEAIIDRKVGDHTVPETWEVLRYEIRTTHWHTIPRSMADHILEEV